MPAFDPAPWQGKIAQADLWQCGGKVTQVIGLTVEACGLRAAVGEICHIHNNGAPPIVAEVVGFKADATLLMPLGDLVGVGPGCRVVATGGEQLIPVGPQLLGRVVDGLGRPLDGRTLPNVT